MSRLTSEELQAVMKHYGVDRIWSWSKLDKFIISPFEYYLKYIAHKDEDRIDCAYASMGGLCHGIIEDYYAEKIKHEDMVSQFDAGYFTNIELVQLKFDRNDSKKNESISSKYKQNLNHFFKNHRHI